MTAPSQDLDTSSVPPPAVEEVRQGIYAYVQPDGTWGLNNTGFIVGDDGVLVIDTCFTEARSRAFIDTIRDHTDTPLRTLVNTHHHGDHTHGNWLLPAATIVGHELCRQAMKATGHTTTDLFPGVEWGEIRVAPSVRHLRGRDSPVCRRPSDTCDPPWHAGPHDQRRGAVAGGRGG